MDIIYGIILITAINTRLIMRELDGMMMETHQWSRGKGATDLGPHDNYHQSLRPIPFFYLKPRFLFFLSRFDGSPRQQSPPAACLVREDTASRLYIVVSHASKC